MVFDGGHFECGWHRSGNFWNLYCCITLSPLFLSLIVVIQLCTVLFYCKVSFFGATVPILQRDYDDYADFYAYFCLLKLILKKRVSWPDPMLLELWVVIIHFYSKSFKTQVWHLPLDDYNSSASQLCVHLRKLFAKTDIWWDYTWVSLTSTSNA